MVVERSVYKGYLLRSTNRFHRALCRRHSSLNMKLRGINEKDPWQLKMSYYLLGASDLHPILLCAQIESVSSAKEQLKVQFL